MTKRSKNTNRTEPLQIPEFRSYEEEAAWFDAHGDMLIERLVKHGKVVPPRIVERTKQLTIRVPVSDIERARVIASSKGLPYQTVLKQAIREGLKKAG
jgi:predicted DNA binding CopG/RHH family protein